MRMSSPASTTVPCPNCGQPASGRFCSNCGATLAAGKCAECGADLPPGAKFCHKCGTPTGAGAKKGGKQAAAAAAPAPATTGIAAAAPWAVAGIALVALIALVFTRQFSNAGAAPSQEASAAAPFAGAAGTGAPDISSMSPRERAERLYNRIMRLDGEGKKDSVAFFAPMAIQSYQMIPDPDADTHYDLGRIAELAGAYPLAKMQADTILAESSTNLLGLALAMRVARDMGDTKSAAAYGKRLRAAAPAERKKDLPGYKLHAPDLDQAIKEATP
jgi:hypothetical protein